jgi:predicted nucleotidyltransferase
MYLLDPRPFGALSCAAKIACAHFPVRGILAPGCHAGCALEPSVGFPRRGRRAITHRMSVSIEQTIATLRQRASAKQAQCEARAAAIRAQLASLAADPEIIGADLWLIGSLAWGGFGTRSDVDVVVRGMPTHRFAALETAWTLAPGVLVDLPRFEGLDLESSAEWSAKGSGSMGDDRSSRMRLARSEAAADLHGYDHAVEEPGATCELRRRPWRSAAHHAGIPQSERIWQKRRQESSGRGVAGPGIQRAS